MRFQPGDIVTIKFWPEILAMSNTPDAKPDQMADCRCGRLTFNSIMRQMCGGSFEIRSTEENPYRKTGESTDEHIYSIWNNDHSDYWYFFSEMFTLDAVCTTSVPTLSFADLFSGAAM